MAVLLFIVVFSFFSCLTHRPKSTSQPLKHRVCESVGSSSTQTLRNEALRSYSAWDAGLAPGWNLDRNGRLLKGRALQLRKQKLGIA